MIKIYKITLLFLITVSCKAQNPIINIEENKGVRSQNIYYKDVNNILNPFEGTYIYTNGTTSFKIILQKKILAYDGRIYEDLLIGEYQYIENGVEKVNTLNNLNATYTNQYDYNICGNWVIKQGLPGCNDCTLNEKRLRLSFKDTISGCWADLIVGKTMIGTQNAIIISIGWKHRLHVVGTPELTQASIPGGEYILIKQ